MKEAGAVSSEDGPKSIVSATGSTPVTDLLAGVTWQCASCPPGTFDDPARLIEIGTWLPAEVPGTAAGALADAGVQGADHRDYDRDDWWFRCRFTSTAGSWRLSAGGLATVADVWVDGQFLWHSENMFRSAARTITLEAGPHELVIRCAALAPILGVRRPRPRWKTYLVGHQNLRWLRTSLLGRIPGWAAVPAPVGPWRPVRLTPANAPVPADVHLLARCDGVGGVVDVSFRMPHDPGRRDPARLHAGEAIAPISVRADGDDLVATGRIRIPTIERWWPHTHGPQPLYDVFVEVGADRVHLGRVGFREVGVDREGGGFRLLVNGEPIFCRGACWLPPDPVRPGDTGSVRPSLELARRCHMNMVRIPGTAVYEDPTFFDACDELGILVWHDCMFAFMDPPEEASLDDEVEAELTEVFTMMSGHPCLAVVCGGQEIEEVAAMNGLAPDAWSVPLLEKRIPSVLDRVLPEIPYLTSNPTGGELPFQMDTGVCQYFGVGGYLRPLEDARHANVRFATECLALSTPPEEETVDERCGGPVAAGHDPAWKRGLHHDAGRSWDMEDVRDFYTRSLFEVDPLRERYVDAAHALDLGRAANAHLMSSVFSEWRRPGSPCSGGLVLALRDLRAGAGWGLIDASGVPKAPWFAIRRVFRPITVLLSDEGLNGLHCHLVNDTARSFTGVLRVALFARGEVCIEEGERPVRVEPRSGTTVDGGAVLGGFRDITYAYRFAAPGHDVVAVTLRDPDGETVAEAFHLPLGQARPREADVGLSAEAFPSGSIWSLRVRTRLFAQWLSVQVPGFVPEDSWFHLEPGMTRTLALAPTAGAGRPRGRVKALNSQLDARIRLVDTP